MNGQRGRRSGPFVASALGLFLAVSATGEAIADQKLSACRAPWQDPVFPCLEAGTPIYGIRQLWRSLNSDGASSTQNAGEQAQTGDTGAAAVSDAQRGAILVQQIRDSAALDLRAKKSVIFQQISAASSHKQLDQTLQNISEAVLLDLRKAEKFAQKEGRQAKTQTDRDVAAMRLRIARNMGAGANAFAEDLAARKRETLPPRYEQKESPNK